MRYNIDPRGYEIALYEKLLYEFPPPGFRVERDDRTVRGRYSLAIRQLDVAVYRRGEVRPFVVADAKYYQEALDVKDVECFIGMLDDVGAALGVLTCPAGYSDAATRRAEASDITTEVISREQALELRWREVARDIYPWDWIFHHELSRALYRLEQGGRSDEIIDALESVAFEEWSEFVTFGLQHHPGEAEAFLRAVAYAHPDAGWRYNAIQRMMEVGALDPVDLGRLRAKECDQEVLELLTEAAEYDDGVDP